MQVAIGELRVVRFGVIFNLKTSASERGVCTNHPNPLAYALLTDVL